MAYEAQVIRRATERLEQRRREHRQEQHRRRDELYAAYPRLKEIDLQLRRMVAEAASAAFLQGQDPGPRIRVLRESNLELQEERRAILLSAGYTEDVLEDAPLCPRCDDRGWQGAEMCTCLRALCAEEQAKLLSSLLPLRDASFETFSLERYSAAPWPGMDQSPQENMELVRDTAWNYARKFPRFALKNLLLSGGTGLGKTFLSACIARMVAENGFSVVYDTAVRVFSAFEEEKFARDETAREATRRYLGCDLLIVDDLGSEMTTAFVQSALYTVINDRLTAGKHTVVSTNLSTGEIMARYSPQIASRLLGEYETLLFYGHDIRLARKEGDDEG